ncbi:MAG TPA: MarR family transcriptional regulator [Thermomonospora sp.]|nr:MarR family transcriptional regulator [Thermomonospora sp.]
MPAPRRDDPVDPLAEVPARWAAQGLTGEPWPFLAICSLSRLHQIVGRALDELLRGLDLGRTGYFLLTTLALISGGRARLSTLSRLVMIHPTTVTLTVDQLERAGLVTREPHPRDRRATLVAITDLGRDRAREANAAVERATGGALGDLAGLHEDLFTALRPARLAVGDTDL